MNIISKQTTKKRKKPRILNVDRVLLGPLTKDTEFLKRLMENEKFITKKKNNYGDDVRDVWQDEVK